MDLKQKYEIIDAMSFDKIGEQEYWKAVIALKTKENCKALSGTNSLIAFYRCCVGIETISPFEKRIFAVSKCFSSFLL